MAELNLKNLSTGLQFPWSRASRLWYILWGIVPIFGWFLLIGYVKTVVLELVKGKNKELPKIEGLGESFVEGVKIVIFLIPTMVVLGLISAIPFGGQALASLIGLFIVPWLLIDFLVTGKFESLWKIQETFDVVIGNSLEYVSSLIKTIVYAIVYGCLSFVLVGIPCLFFGQGYFLADFYRKHSKGKKK
ncbi:DUF4013 domain-containing protein [Candidatus Woesearchaeota archaeon]|nr:DUF4013 domain-containing protein [Candidatus Woesearchaeota archaeon]